MCLLQEFLHCPRSKRTYMLFRKKIFNVEYSFHFFVSRFKTVGEKLNVLLQVGQTLNSVGLQYSSIMKLLLRCKAVS